MLWNGMCNFFSKVMSGEKSISLSIPQKEKEEKEQELERMSSTPPTEELLFFAREGKEDPLLYSLKLLVFTGPTRQPRTIVVGDNKAYQEVRNEVARIMDIHDVKTCVFVQATKEFGLWYQYGSGMCNGAVMGREQNTGTFYSYNPDWDNVEDEITRHGHMIQPRTSLPLLLAERKEREEEKKEKKRERTPPPPSLREERDEEKEEEPFLRRQRRSKRIANRQEGLIL